MTEIENKNKIVTDLILDLGSKDSKILTSALKRVRSKGNEEVIPYLFKIIKENTNNKVKEEAKKIIVELKSTASIPKLLNELENGTTETKELVLSAFWQTGFNPVSYIHHFVKAAIKGTYMEAVETFTIIDSLDGPFEEEPIIESQLLLKEYFSNNKSENDKYDLMKSIALMLDNYEKSI